MTFNNKWIRAVLPALLIHISIGSVYAWSLFIAPISQQLNKSTQEIQFVFSLAIFFLGMSAAFGGRLVEKNIRKSTIISMVCFCGGLLITAFSIYFKSLIGIYIGYGCVMGIGLGVGYLTPVKNLLLWFDKQKGLATGIAVTGFGAGSALASPIITYLLGKTTLTNTFLILGLIYILPMLIAYFLIKRPDWYIAESNKAINTKEDNFKLLSMFKNKTFILIWIMLYINISCGLSLISIASPVMKDLNFSLATIALVVGIMGIFNGSGRLVFSAISDKFKHRSNIYKVIFILSIASILIAFASSKLIFITLIIISTCYGAGFSNLPSLLADKFGMDNISKIHGLSLTAWAIAGLTGNQVSTLVKNVSGSYLNVLWVISIGYLVGLVISFRLRKES